MSGYWDAVGRAALGLTGSAAPRPRSIFEPDDLAATSSGLDLLDDAAAAQPTPPRAAAQSSPDTPVLRDVSVPSDQPLDLAASEDGAEPRPDDSFLARSVDPEGPEPGTTRTPEDSPVEQREITTQQIVEHVEVHHVETTHTREEIAEREQLTAQPMVEGLAALLPETPEDADVSASQAEHMAEVPDEEPALLVAEPLVVTRESPALPGQAQEPPLVIEIERIDIRIESEPPASAPPVASRRRESATVPSLADYLARRSEARR